MHSDWISSPGMGTTPTFLSLEPLATEGEATLGSDDDVDESEISEAVFGSGEMPALDVPGPEQPALEAEFELPEFRF